MTNQPTCSCNKSRDCDELEQRYQQLERVAVEMLNHFNTLRKMEPYVFGKIAKSYIEELCLIFAEELEELGVEL